MTASKDRPFSVGWVVVSVFVFLGLELLLGGVVANAVSGRYLSAPVELQIQSMMRLFAYFTGGLLVGLFSPGVRMAEPAVAAGVSVFLTLLISVFLPYRFMVLSLDRLLIGGGIAFGLAMFGAYVGERLAGNVD